MFVSRALVLLAAALFARAEIYVTQPASGSSCHGGQSCTVEWLDDGNTPLLSAIGSCKVGLYSGDLQLIQSIDTINVDSSHSLSFTPNPPIAGSYYIAFVPASGGSYIGYSPWFNIDSQSGTPPPSVTGNYSTTITTGTKPTTSSTETYTETGTTSGGTYTATSTGTYTATGTSSGFSTAYTSTSSTSTFAHTTTSATKSNAAVPNNIPTTGFVWSLMALCGAALL